MSGVKCRVINERNLKNIKLFLDLMTILKFCREIKGNLILLTCLIKWIRL